MESVEDMEEVRPFGLTRVRVRVRVRVRIWKR